MEPLIALVLVAGCRSESRPGAAPAEEIPSAGESGTAVSLAVRTGPVDSAIPIPEALRRFREGLPKVVRLTGGYPSREKLVGAFVRAVETRGHRGAAQMVLRKDEFAWLYYPASPLSRPPYELPPELMWFQMQGESERGATRLLAERAGEPLRYTRHLCGAPRTEGELRVYPNCQLFRMTAQGDSVSERLFGLIAEQRGTYKFVSYANRLD